MRFILHRYILGDLLKAFVLSTAALTLFLAMAYALGQLREYGLGPIDSLQMVMFFVPAMLIFAMPVSALLTTTLVYGRLASENEITACRSAGISMATVLWPVVVLAMGLGVINYVLFDTVIPIARYQAENVATENMQRIFFHKMQTERYVRFGDFYINAERVEGNMLYGVNADIVGAAGARYKGSAGAARVEFFSPGELTEAASRQGRHENGEPPTREEVARESANADVIDHGWVRIKLFDLQASDVGRTRFVGGDPSVWRSLKMVRTRDPKELTFAGLWGLYRRPELSFRYKYAESRGAGAKALAETAELIKARCLAEAHSRYASLVSCVLLVGLGAGLGMIFRHGHILMAFFISMGPALFAIFAILVGVNMVRSNPDSMHGLVGVIWAGNLVVAVLDAVLLGWILRH